MGAGIAIDVTFATLAKFHDTNLSFRNWTLPITTTHILFPAFGYFVFWGVAEVLPWLRPFLGITGGILVALLVYEMIAEEADLEPVIAISHGISKLLPISTDHTRHFMAVLAVSWDALLSGPAMAAQAKAAAWDTTEVVGAIIIAGLVVALIAESSLKFTLYLRSFRTHDIRRIAHFNFWGRYAEWSVIGGFGILSFWEAGAENGNLYWSVLIAAGLVGICFILFHKELMESAFLKAETDFA
jgi:hypothetical protein